MPFTFTLYKVVVLFFLIVISQHFLNTKSIKRMSFRQKYSNFARKM